MLRTETPFLPTMLAVVLATLLLVMSTAFIVIRMPWAGIPANPGCPQCKADSFIPPETRPECKHPH